MTNYQRTMASWPSPPTHRGFSIDFFEAWEATAPPASSAKRAWISWDDHHGETFGERSEPTMTDGENSKDYRVISSFTYMIIMMV